MQKVLSKRYKLNLRLLPDKIAYPSSDLVYVVEKELNVLFFFPDKVEWSSFSHSFNDLVANKKKVSNRKNENKEII